MREHVESARRDAGPARAAQRRRDPLDGVARAVASGRVTPGTLQTLQRTAGNAAAARILARSREQCNASSETDGRLAAIEQRIADNAMSRLDDPQAAHEEADAIAVKNFGKRVEWCGIFAEMAYLSQGFDRAILPASFESTLKVWSFFNYKYGAFGTYPKRYVKDDEGSWKEVDQYHAERGSRRCWIPTAGVSAGDLDIRPGDVATLSVAHGKNTETAAGDHVVVVQSYDPSTGRLFTIGGNDGGYVVRNGDPPPNESAAETERREALEAATGRNLQKGPGGGHVGVGMQDLRHQQVGKSGTKVAHTHVAGIGRPSIVDFEQHEYSNNPAGRTPGSARKSKPEAKPASPAQSTNGAGQPSSGVITLPEVTIVGEVPTHGGHPTADGGGGSGQAPGNVITLPEVTIVGEVPKAPAVEPPKPSSGSKSGGGSSSFGGGSKGLPALAAGMDWTGSAGADPSALQAIVDARNAVPIRSPFKAKIAYRGKANMGYQYAGKGSIEGTGGRLVKLGMKEFFGGEGRTSAVVTYDGTLSFGAGFANGLAAAWMVRWFASDPAARKELEQVGMTVLPNGTGWMVLDDTGNVLKGEPARQFIRNSPALLSAFADAAEAHGDTAGDAQLQQFKQQLAGIPAGLQAEMESWPSDSVVAATLHLMWWLPAGGPSGSPKRYLGAGGDAYTVARAFAFGLAGLKDPKQQFYPSLPRPTAAKVIGAGSLTGGIMTHYFKAFGSAGKDQGVLKRAVEEKGAKLSISANDALADTSLDGHVLIVDAGKIQQPPAPDATVTMYDVTAEP